jgi:hypothetical protein
MPRSSAGKIRSTSAAEFNLPADRIGSGRKNEKTGQIWIVAFNELYRSSPYYVQQKNAFLLL